MKKIIIGLVAFAMLAPAMTAEAAETTTPKPTGKTPGTIIDISGAETTQSKDPKDTGGKRDTSIIIIEEREEEDFLWISEEEEEETTYWESRSRISRSLRNRARRQRDTLVEKSGGWRTVVSQATWKTVVDINLPKGGKIRQIAEQGEGISYRYRGRKISYDRAKSLAASSKR